MLKRASVWKRFTVSGLALLAAGSVPAADAQGQSAASAPRFATLPQPALPFTRAARRIAARAAAAPVQITVTLRLPNENAVDAFLADAQDPLSPQYHQFLTPQQFADRFGPTQAALDQVKAHLIANGLKITNVSANRLAISAQGSAAQAQKAFGVVIAEYQDAAAAFYANTTAPTLPAAIAPLVQHVFGLDNYPVPLLHARRNPGGNGYTPPQIQTAYNLKSLYGAGYTGSGVTVAIVSLYSYDPASAASYGRNFVASTYVPKITTINVDGGPGAYNSQGSGTVEANLDIDMVLANAYNSTILFYQGNYKNSLQELYNVTAKVVSDNKADIVTTSYGFGEKYWSGNLPTATTSYHNVLQSAAAQGMTCYVSSGDEGATGRDISGSNLIHDELTMSYPGSDPNIISVGGTTLFVNSSNQITKEEGWSSAYQTGGASGGGISQIWAAPAWQAFTGNAKRAAPDVSLNADGYSGYLIYDPSVGSGTVGGTSASSPMWAAASAVMWEYAQKLGYPLRQGNIAPAYYALGGSSAFHDITLGSNRYVDSAGRAYQYYNCLTGYDLATGWGSADFSALALALFPTISTLQVNPAAVTGGQATTGYITLNTAATTALVVTLASSNAAVASVPATATVAAGSNSVTFPVTTHSVTAAQTVTLTATYKSVSRAATLTVNNGSAAAPTLTGLTLAPTSIIGGTQNSTGTVSLSGAAPTGGVTVTLASSDTAAATTPASVTVGAGSASATFTLVSNKVTATHTPTITATYSGVSKTALLTVTATPTGATITGSIYNDLNDNGHQEAGEPGLSGWQVYLDLNNNGQYDAGEPTATADAAGTYKFTGLAAGTYYIYGYSVPAGWHASEPYYPYDGYSVTLTANGVSRTNFGYSQSALLAGILYNDVNTNGTQDAGETGLSGWFVYLDTNGNGKYDSGEPVTTTDADGYYSFAVAPGSYDIYVIPQAGWTQGEPVGYDGYTATVGTSEVSPSWDFGYSRTSPTFTLSGTVALEGINPQAAAQSVGFTLVPVGGGTTYYLAENIPPTGEFTLNNIPAGQYQVHIKGDLWLAVNALNTDLSAADYTAINVTLPAGDANNDNSVDSTDFTALIGAFNSSAAIPGSGYDAKADFNCDGFVDSSDFTLLIGEFNNVGASTPTR